MARELAKRPALHSACARRRGGPTPRLAGPRYHPLWRQISGAWVNTHGNPGTVAVCLETAWNTPQSTTENYRAVGRRLGLTVVQYLKKRSE
jgi:hypothetical protein